MLSKSSIKTLIASSLGSFYATVMEKVDSNISAAIADHNNSMASSGQSGHMSSAHFSKLEGIEEKAQKNQNAISNVKVDTVTVAAGTTTDTVEIVAGDNVTVTADAATKKITVAGDYNTFGKSNDGLVPKYASDAANLYLGTTGWKAIQSASTAGSGIVQLSDGIEDASADKAATANAVKKALEAAKEYANTVKSELLGDAPSDALNTLKKLGDALGDDENFAATMTTALADKSDTNHTHVGSDLKIGTYAKATKDADIDTTDNIASALGKVEYRVKNLVDNGSGKWATPIDFKLEGAVTSSAVSVDGSQNITISTTLSNLESNKVTAMTGYNIASMKAVADVTATDSLNTAVGKVEYRIKNLNLSDLFGTDVTGASLEKYGITDAYTSDQGTALEGRVTTLETLCNTTLGGAESVTQQDVADIMQAVNEAINTK